MSAAAAVREVVAPSSPSCGSSDFMHVFKSLNFDIRFGLVVATHIPIIMSAQSDIPEASPFICLYYDSSSYITNGSVPIIPAFHSRIFKQVEKRLLSLRETPAQADEFSITQLLVCETVGHLTRRAACFEPDIAIQKQKFERAYNIYEGVILSICHSSLNESIHTIRKGPKKAIIFQPFEGLNTFTPDARRLISHCLAGMAICVLMSERSTNKYISLASEAVCVEVKRPLELACTLRMFPLIMCSDESFPEVVKMFVIHREISSKVILPLMLRMGHQNLFDVELSFIESDKQVQCSQFAQDMVARIATRLSSPAPLATVNTHVIDGKIVERNCAACGVWDRTGKSYRRCKACMMVYYCGKECQLAHWKMHKTVCNK